MKTINNLFWVLLLCGISACQQEKELQPRSWESAVIHDFPQGNDSWDVELQQIAERFGTKCIYKDLTSKDLSRFWVALSGSGDYRGQGLTEDRQKKWYTRFFCDHIFKFLNPEHTKGVLPTYIYFAYDFYQNNLQTDDETGEVTEYQTEMKMNYMGLGYWAFCYASEKHVNNRGREWQSVLFTKSRDVLQNREIVLKNIFKKLVENGNIVYPPQFAYGGGLDYKTPIVYNNTSDNQYYKRRGFPEQLRNYTNYAYPGDLYEIESANPTNTFMDYLWLAFRYSREQLVQRYKDFPLVLQYYDITVEYMRSNYDMDITQIAEIPSDLIIDN